MDSQIPDIYYLNFNQKIVYLISILILCSCQSTPNTTVPATPVVVEILSMPDWTETPAPACISLPEIQLSIDLLSENSVHIKITGLEPNEPVYTIFNSRYEEKEKSVSCCPGEVADEQGNYEYNAGLRGQETDAEFINWHVQVVHSRGSACTDFILP